MDEWIKQIIKNTADKYRKEIKGGLLYGYPIDMDNPDMVITAIVCKLIHEDELRKAHNIDTILFMERR